MRHIDIEACAVRKGRALGGTGMDRHRLLHSCAGSSSLDAVNTALASCGYRKLVSLTNDSSFTCYAQCQSLKRDFQFSEVRLAIHNCRAVHRRLAMATWHAPQPRSLRDGGVERGLDT